MSNNGQPPELRIQKRLKLLKILKYALNIPAIAFLVVAVFVLKTAPWIIASSVILVVTLFTINYLTLLTQRQAEELLREKTREAAANSMYAPAAELSPGTEPNSADTDDGNKAE